MKSSETSHLQKRTTAMPGRALALALVLSALVALSALAAPQQQAHADSGDTASPAVHALAAGDAALADNAADAGATAGSTGQAGASAGADAASPSTAETAAGQAGQTSPETAPSTAAPSEAPATETAPEASLKYRAKVDGSWQAWKADPASAGATSADARMTAFQIQLETDAEGAVQYQVHAAAGGWKAATEDSFSAKVAANDAIDAFRIALVGELSRWYDVSYRGYTPEAGWLNWASNGKICGSAGSGEPITALQVRLIRKTNPAEQEGAGIVGVRYKAKVRYGGWTEPKTGYKVAGTAKKRANQLTSVRIDLDTGAYNGTVKYRAHLAGGKWTSWTTDWGSIGSHANIEALQIKLGGEISKRYDIVYRGYVQTVGWQRRMRNGETLGKVGAGLPIKALKIKLEAKGAQSGWIASDGEWSFYKKGAVLAGQWLDTKESPIDTTAKGAHRYWLDANGKLAVQRFVNPADEADAAADYAAYATENGWLQTGKRSGEEGVTFADEEGRLRTDDNRWLDADEADGSTQRYRLVNNGFYSVAQTGLFEVNGKKYYGWEDGRGYVMRSRTAWVGDAWYKAGASGALKNVDAQTAKHVERYVKWALAISKDDAHGYSQANRWGPDYDCSSLVVSALREAGFPESGALWTGNMKSTLKKIGFVWHKGTGGLKRGDILLVHASYRQHTEIYLGNGKLVGAHSSENGGINGRAGDQTGNEISVGAYYNAPWQGYLRYRG